nr:hypothetical protein [Tanacetum cinerariifolium]
MRIVLQAEKKLTFLEQPIPTFLVRVRPAIEVAHDVIAFHTCLVDTQQVMACLILASMTLDLQKNQEDYTANDMLKELKTMFSQHEKQELLDTVKAFHACKQKEGKYVSSYVLKMKGYLEQLECLNNPVPLELGKNVAPAPVVIAIKAGKIQKKNKKPHVAHGKGQGKGKAKLSYAPKPNIPQPPKKDPLLRTRFATNVGRWVIVGGIGLRGSKKLKPCTLNLYVGNDHCVAVKVIGSFDLCLPSGLYPKYDKWLEAMNVEMQSMKDNQVWNLVDLLLNAKIIRSKWLFKRKTDMDGKTSASEERTKIRMTESMSIGKWLTDSQRPSLNEDLNILVGTSQKQNNKLRQKRGVFSKGRDFRYLRVSATADKGLGQRPRSEFRFNIKGYRPEVSGLSPFLRDSEEVNQLPVQSSFGDGLRESVSHLPILTDSIILILVLSSIAEEASTAKYIVQQYMATIEGLQALNSVQNLCAIGQVKISVSEFHQRDERSNSKISWRQSSNQLRPMTKGPPRPIRRFLQGLDPRSTGDLFLQAPKMRLLVKFEDSRLLTVNGDNGDGIFWETSTESVIEDYRAQRLANTHDPLALMANTHTPFHPDQSSHITCIQNLQPNNNFFPEPSLNTNYLQHPMQNPKDISNPTTALDMALKLMAKAFQLNNSTLTNNNQRSSSNPYNSQIAQSGMNMDQDRHMLMVDDNNVGNRNELSVVLKIANQYGNGNVETTPAEGNGNGINGNPISTQEEFELMAAADAYEETERVKVNCTSEDTLQQASTSETQSDNAPVYDSDGSPEVFLKVGESNALSKLVPPNSAPSSRESTLVNNERVIAPGIFRINHFKAFRVDNFVPNKYVKASVRTKPITVSQPHVITKKDVNTITNGFSPKNVESTTRTRRLQSRNNPKNDNVPFKPKSSCLSNNLEKIEENHKNLQSSSNQKHMSSKCNNIKLLFGMLNLKLFALCKVYLVICSTNYSNGENQVVSKSSAVTTADAFDKRQQQLDSTSSTSTLATTITADENFDL